MIGFINTLYNQLVLTSIQGYRWFTQWDSSVGIATDYGLDDQEVREFESR
jgi:hypothetical protein